MSADKYEPKPDRFGHYKCNPDKNSECSKEYGCFRNGGNCSHTCYAEFAVREISFTIPHAPITKKNSQKIMKNKINGRRWISPSEAYKSYERVASCYMPRIAQISHPVTVKCLFYMPTRRKTDLTNLLEAIDDILVNQGILEDDNYQIIASHDGSRVYYDKDNPRTEVTIEDFVE